MDVVALYPSLDQDKSPETVAEAIMESDVTFAGAVLDVARVYLVNVWDKNRLKREKLYHLMPRKKTNKGRKATVNSR